MPTPSSEDRRRFYLESRMEIRSQTRHKETKQVKEVLWDPKTEVALRLTSEIYL